MLDVAIIGGGPSGIAAALKIKELRPSLEVAVLERNDAIGRKLKATGNGRCNIANTSYESYAEVSEFLGQLGIALRVYDNGLVYPYSESAKDVVSLLESRLHDAGVKVLTGYEVRSVECRESNKDPGAEAGTECKESNNNPGTKAGFVINGDLDCKHLVLATGGKAGPAFGTIGDGYRLARELGHSIVTPVPILTSIETDGAKARDLGGIRAKGIASLYDCENKIFEEEGEIQFTPYGLSGICIFNMTRHMRYAKGESITKFKIKLNLVADTDLGVYIYSRIEAARKTDDSESMVSKKRTCASDIGAPMERVKTLLRTVFRTNLTAEVISQSSVSDKKLIRDLTSDDVAAIVRAASALEFTPTGIKGWKEAQCTMGGVSLDEVDKECSRSKLHKNLYITGELLDYDGPCGGYNLANAWITGIRAGRSIADDAL